MGIVPTNSEGSRAIKLGDITVGGQRIDDLKPK